ncbi:hypothetical protein H4R99_001886 [Coemansia sp. RSA 1722]|nr:hypothetical protein IWW45_007203 [Coemansia sp. RSA 485]KAJ2604328.1 hypothetical protein H4R99_001886 [Coemansia sp. RSA 1722]KAJ2705655.1 hypothetical protein FB645_002250 [Coemansia sp. IMI 203386]
MFVSVPDYILSSGVMAQQTRGRSANSRGRPSSLTSEASASSSTSHLPGADDETQYLETESESSSEIKAVLGLIAAPQRGWLQNQHCDVPRLIQL